jgi:superfamily II DNA or RNA helicase
MAKILDYIGKQITQVNETIDSDTLLKNEGMYIIAKYIAKNPNFINGNSIPFISSGKYSRESLVDGSFGVNAFFWKELKLTAHTKGKNKNNYFKDKILTFEGSKDLEVKKFIEKLYSKEVAVYNNIVDALVNFINYKVMNISFQSQSITMYDKIYNNINYVSLPYGIVNSIATSDINFLKEYRSIDEDSFKIILKQLCPKNLNLEEYTIEKTAKFFDAVINKDLNSVKIKYKRNKAEGYIVNDRTEVIISEDYICTPLSISTEVDTSFYTGGYTSKDTINKNATKFSLSPVSSEKRCSAEDLEEISKKANFVKDLENNKDFVKVSGIKGKDILNSIEPFNILSRNFYDTYWSEEPTYKQSVNGFKAISIKLYFDKINEIFINLRSNDLYFALTCATYMDDKDETIDIYFNPKNDEAYFVNSNKEQYGFCKGVSAGLLSKSEYILYAELYKPSLSIVQKTKIFEEQDVKPIIVSEDVINESEALQDALIRQSKLIDIKESDLFYKLFIDNIASFIYTYAEQVKVNGVLKWKNKINPNWSLDSSEGKVIKGKDGKEQWSNPDYFYIYDVREAFWMNNQEMSIEEVLAYFVTKGGSKKDNSSYFRKLSQRILGVDYFIFSDKLFPILLDKGYICIEKLSIATGTGQVTEKKYTYSYEYSSGDVYKKIEILNKELEDNIIEYYGDRRGNIIVDNQNYILTKSKPERLTFGDKNPSLNLMLNIHNPIFYADSEGFVGRVAKERGIFRDGKVRISTIENEIDTKYKNIELGGSSKKSQYNDFIKKNNLKISNNHLKKFYEWIVFGQGVDFISSPNLKQNEFYIVDGYIFPMSSAKFINKHILPKFEKIADEGQNTPCPLKFIETLGSQQKTFTLGNIYKKKNEKYQFSNLTEESRQNLIKIGLVDNKPKKSVEVKIKDPNDPEKTITKKQMFTPITEEEGKRIFSVIYDKYKKLESQIILEGNNLFTTFCKIQLTPEYRKNIEELWNKTYNNMAIANYSKFPIFCEHSRWFGSLPSPFLFSLRDAQVEGMKFAIANKNSGLLAHEVGFGKTTTSIAMISHMVLTGDSSRTIVFTPNQVYEKFADEIVGRDTTKTLGLLTNWQVIEKNKKDNKTDAIDIIKFGNASSNLLLNKDNKLKSFTDEELLIIQKWKGKGKVKGKKRTEDDKGVVEMAKDQLKNLPAFAPTFLPEDKRGNTNESRFTSAQLESDFNDWYDNFMVALSMKIPQIFYGDADATEEAVMGILNKIDKSAQKIYDEVNSEYLKFQSGYRYTISDFTGENKSKIVKYPQSIQNWWKKSKPKKDEPKLGKNDYPQKGWVSNLDDALLDGVINKSQYDRIKARETQLNLPWEGVLSQQGIKDIKIKESTLALKFFNPIDNKNSGKVTNLLKQIEGMLIDVLGEYDKRVLEPNKIILCNHEAISRFRADDEANVKAKMYIQNVDDESYVNTSTNRFYDEISNLPLSFKKLNLDGICVDEIHNFNNLITQPREQSLSNVPSIRGSSIDKQFHILPTMNASAILDKLPDGLKLTGAEQGLNVEEGTPYHNVENFNKPKTGSKPDSSYRLKYYSKSAKNLSTKPANLIALIFEIQAKEENKAVNNTILMSATPFTDNIFQMFSVFGMTNLDKMKESNISSVWDFFVTFVNEEWRFKITHKQTFGLFPEIQSYYNSGAMSNFIKAMANFKVSDKIIEADRPLKYYIPQDGTGGEYQAGANTSSVQWAKQLQDVSSYVPLSDIQTEILKKIALYVEGKIDIPFQYCPNYGDAIKIDEETQEIIFLNDEVKESIQVVDSLLTKAGLLKKKNKDENFKTEEEGSLEWEELLYEARALLVDLRLTYPQDKRIALKQSLVDKEILTPEEILDSEEDELLYNSNYKDMDLTANSKSEVKMARAIVGQGFGQMCVISPYLLKCDAEGEIPNDLLKDYPLYPNDISKSAKNFVENSPKIKYAIECAINTIKYDSKEGGINNREVGGQILYINRGKAFKYGGHYYNLYELIKTYIIDRNISYYDNITEKVGTITKENIGVITGAMSGQVKATDKFGKTELDEETKKDKKIGRREDIRDKFNDGRIKILIGSSAIKEGIDLNKRAHTLYILDSDFSPSNAMQLEGRIWRQKNMWEFVRIVYVLGIDSIDAFVYSKLQTKIGEIKKMLEAGVYELNKTQYTIDAKERIRNIITDVNQLTDLAWQDKVDELNSKVANFSDKKSKLESIKSKYGEVKDEFNSYVVLMNSLYSLVKYDEKKKIAEREKDKLDIQIIYDFKKESRGRGRDWKENNKPNLTSIDQAIEIVEQQAENGLIEFVNPDIILNTESDMVLVNTVGDSVRKMLKKDRGMIDNILDLTAYSLEDRKRELRSVNSESQLGFQMVKIILDHFKLFELKGRVFGYEMIVYEVNKFATGTEYQRVMSNYCYLVKNIIKNEEKGETYSFSDIDILITKAKNKVVEGRNELGSEKKWKIDNRIKEEESQLLKSKRRGDNLETLIDKFNNSMSLLKIRVK